MVRSSQWDAAAVMTQMAAATLRTLPPPADGVLYLIGDSTVKDQRGRKHPLGHTTRHSEHDPSTFGFEMVLMIASGERFRVPIALVPIDPQMKGHQNILFRQLLQDFVPPSWTRPVVVIADAGFCGTGASGHAGREYLMPHYETVRPGLRGWFGNMGTTHALLC
jgi:hypothetical protein